MKIPNIEFLVPLIKSDPKKVEDYIEALEKQGFKPEDIPEAKVEKSQVGSIFKDPTVEEWQRARWVDGKVKEFAVEPNNIMFDQSMKGLQVFDSEGLPIEDLTKANAAAAEAMEVEEETSEDKSNFTPNTASLYIKDLSKLGRNPENTIILDNDPDAYQLQPSQGLPIETWENNPADQELTDFISILILLSRMSDSRYAIR